MEVELCGNSVAVVIKRKKIKNIYFRFDDAFNLVVSASRFVSDKEIFKLIEKNRKSLEKMYVKFSNKKQKENEFWYLGMKYDIIFDEMMSEVEFNDGVVFCKNVLQLNNFLKKQTTEIFSDEVEHLKKVIPVPNFTLKIRRMKTRWGVCNYKLKTITLNSELIRYSKEHLRYVIVHEMCHFFHHDHGKSFWNMVEEYYPNYKQIRKELRY